MFTRILPSLPALVSLLCFWGLVAKGIFCSDQISNAYRAAARSAIASEDLTRAKFYYSRLIGEGDQGSVADQFNLISILRASGEVNAANDLMKRLAPDDQMGYPPAHKLRALSLQESVKANGPSKELLKKYQWHLTHGAQEKTLQNDLLWANYHLVVKEFTEAVLRLTSAASRDPNLWFDIANLYEQMGRRLDARKARQRAESHARQRLDDEPVNVTQRIRLAEILRKDDRLKELRELLQEGLRISGDDPAMRRAASNFLLFQITQNKKARSSEPSLSADDAFKKKSLVFDATDLQRQFLLLQQAVKLDPQSPNIYQMLAAFYDQLDTAKAKRECRKQLQRWITEGLEVPYAHFTLGNLLFLEDDREGALFHLERAIQLDPTLTSVTNNLAWILAQGEAPDLERAESLIQAAIEISPENARFADTYGDILFQQKRYEEALAQYEKALPRRRGPARIKTHQRLAEIYNQLHRPELAQSHRDRITELERAQ